VEDYPRDLLELEARFSTEAACGKLFYRLAQQAVATDSVPLSQIIHRDIE